MGYEVSVCSIHRFSCMLIISSATWIPYFDDGTLLLNLNIPTLLTHSKVDSVIFLCPISAFNEVLLEDRTVNRLVSHLRVLNGSFTQMDPTGEHSTIASVFGRYCAQVNY